MRVIASLLAATCLALPGCGETAPPTHHTHIAHARYLTLRGPTGPLASYPNAREITITENGGDYTTVFTTARGVRITAVTVLVPFVSSFKPTFPVESRGRDDAGTLREIAARLEGGQDE